jgi:hypothetical protein
MEALNKIIAYIETLDRRHFRLHVLGFMVGIVTISAGLLYTIQSKKEALIQRLQVLNNLAIKANEIIATNTSITKDEQRLKELLMQKRGFSIQAFFEQFCREQNVNPEAGWATKQERVSDIFDEIVLTAQFKNLTSDKLVKLLDALNKEEIVYLKDLQIKSTPNKKISVSMTMATKSYKSSLD